MRTKDDILQATISNSEIASGAKDISLIHSLHTLEVLIDIRDLFDTRLGILFNLLLDWKDKS